MNENIYQNRKIIIPQDLKYRAIKNIVFIFRPNYGEHVLKNSGFQIWESIASSSCSLNDLINQWTSGLSAHDSVEINRRKSSIESFIDKLYFSGLISFEKDNLNGCMKTQMKKRIVDGKNNNVDNILNIGFENNIPITVEINITDHCNLKCPYCYASHSYQVRERAYSKGSEEKAFFCVDDLKDLLQQLADSGCFYLTLTG